MGCEKSPWRRRWVPEDEGHAVDDEEEAAHHRHGRKEGAPHVQRGWREPADEGGRAVADADGLHLAVSRGPVGDLRHGEEQHALGGPERVLLRLLPTLWFVVADMDGDPFLRRGWLLAAVELLATVDDRDPRAPLQLPEDGLVHGDVQQQGGAVLRPHRPHRGGVAAFVFFGSVIAALLPFGPAPARLDQAREGRPLEPLRQGERRARGRRHRLAVPDERPRQARVERPRLRQPVLHRALDGCGREARARQCRLADREQLLRDPLHLRGDGVGGHQGQAEETGEDEEAGEQDERHHRYEEVRDEELAADAPQQATHQVAAEAVEAPGAEDDEDDAVQGGDRIGQGHADQLEREEEEGDDQDLARAAPGEAAQPSRGAVRGGRGTGSGQQAETGGHRAYSRGRVRGGPDYSTRAFGTVSLTGPTRVG